MAAGDKVAFRIVAHLSVILLLPSPHHGAHFVVSHFLFGMLKHETKISNFHVMSLLILFAKDEIQIMHWLFR